MRDQMEIAPIWRKDGPSVPTRKAALDTGRAFVRHSHSSHRSNELGRSWVCRYRSSIGWRPPPATCSPLEVFLRNMLALDAVVPVRRLLALVEPLLSPCDPSVSHLSCARWRTILVAKLCATARANFPGRRIPVISPGWRRQLVAAYPATVTSSGH